MIVSAHSSAKVSAHAVPKSATKAKQSGSSFSDIENQFKKAAAANPKFGLRDFLKTILGSLGHAIGKGLKTGVKDAGKAVHDVGAAVGDIKNGVVDLTTKTLGGAVKTVKDVLIPNDKKNSTFTFAAVTGFSSSSSPSLPF